MCSFSKICVYLFVESLYHSASFILISLGWPIQAFGEIFYRPWMATSFVPPSSSLPTLHHPSSSPSDTRTQQHASILGFQLAPDLYTHFPVLHPPVAPVSQSAHGLLPLWPHPRRRVAPSYQEHDLPKLYHRVLRSPGYTACVGKGVGKDCWEERGRMGREGVGLDVDDWKWR